MTDIDTDALAAQIAERLHEYLAIHVELRPKDRPFLTPLEAAEVMGIGERTVWGQIQRGELPSVKVGGRRMVPRAAFESWLEAVGATATKRTVRERKVA